MLPGRALSMGAFQGSGGLALGQGGGAVVIPAPKGFVAKGDSLTLGSGTTGGSREYPPALARIVGIALAANYGVSGQVVATANTNYPSEGGSAYNALTADTYLFFMGTNDSGAGTAAATTISRIQTHINLALATGYRVAIGTIPKRGDNAPAQALNDTINAYIRANWASMGATWFFDLDLWPTLQTPSSTTYYNADTLHFNNDGYWEVAKCVQAGLGLASLSARGSNGALRFRANPPDFYASKNNPVAFVVSSMQQGTIGNTSAAVLGKITAKSVYAFKFPTNLTSFTSPGVMIDGADTTNAMGLGGAGSGAAWFDNGAVYAAGVNTNSGLSGFTSADTIGVVVDPIAKKIWWTKDGTNFTGVGTAAVTLANVIAGTGSTAQAWASDIYASAGGFGGGIATVVQSVPYPWTPPTGYTQL